MVRVVLMSVALMVGIGKQNPDVRGEEDSTFGRTVCVSAVRGRGLFSDRKPNCQLPVVLKLLVPTLLMCVFDKRKNLGLCLEAK
jgi:hypothetical protein